MNEGFGLGYELIFGGFYVLRSMAELKLEVRQKWAKEPRDSRSGCVRGGNGIFKRGNLGF